MAGIGDTLSLGSSGLAAYQSQINVYSQNIANIDTAGYVRRELNLEAMASSSGLGTGVQTGDVSRTFNLLRNNTMLREESNAQYHAELADILDELEILSGSSNGLSDSLQAFESAWAAVAAAPEDLAARSVLLQKSNSLATRFNEAATRLDEFTEGLASSSTPMSGLSADTVAEINTSTERLQELNQRIAKYALTGNTAPELRDERDRLVREMSGNANIAVTPDYRITLGGQELVSADGLARQELVQTDSATFSVNGTDISTLVTGGKLAAVRDAYATASGMSLELDDLAASVADQVNTLFNSAYNLSGTTPDSEGYTFFTGSTAGTLAVDTALYDPDSAMSSHPERIAVAMTLTGSVANAGDNTAAQAITNALAGSTSALGGMSNMDFLLDMETKLAAAVSEETTLASDGVKMVEMLDSKIQAESGVNLDEEMMNLMTAQQAYEASARVFSTANEMLDILMNM